MEERIARGEELAQDQIRLDAQDSIGYIKATLHSIDVELQRYEGQLTFHWTDADHLAYIDRKLSRLFMEMVQLR